MWANSKKFLGSALVLSIGTAFAQLIPIAITPILTRLYSPAEFGVVSAYMAVASILSVVATGRYEMAINQPTNDNEAAVVTRLALELCVLFSVLLFIPIYLWSTLIAAFLGDPNVSYWLFLIPFAVLITGAINTIQLWNSRQLNFKEITKGTVQSSILVSLFNIALGVGKIQHGMLLGAMLGQLISALAMLRDVDRKYKTFFLEIKWSEKWSAARNYRRYPLFLVPAHVLGAGAQQIPLLTMSVYFQSAAAGYFSMAYRLLILPAAVISAPIGDVFRAKASQNLIEGKEIRNMYLAVLAGMSILGIIPFVAIGFALPTIFDFVLGPSWQQAAIMGQILIFPAYFQFIAAAVDKVFLVVGMTTFEVITQLTRLFCFIPLMVFMTREFVNIETAVTWISWALSIFYLTVIALSLYVACCHVKENTDARNGL
jgi:O-antigen/teichoic acid export membrane protein